MTDEERLRALLDPAARAARRDSAIQRRQEAATRHGSQRRWSEKHGPMSDGLIATCADCHHTGTRSGERLTRVVLYADADIPRNEGFSWEERYNPRYGESRTRAEVILRERMIGTACLSCGSSDVRIMTRAEWSGLETTRRWSFRKLARQRRRARTRARMSGALVRVQLSDGSVEWVDRDVLNWFLDNLPEQG